MIPSLLSRTERPKVYYNKGDLKFNYLKYDCENNSRIKFVYPKNKRTKEQEKEWKPRAKMDFLTVSYIWKVIFKMEGFFSPKENLISL